ncbi:MAG: 4-Cys prefix domain-containing protein [Elainellaceae cyanobacterium]
MSHCYCLNPACPRPETPDRTDVCQACGASLTLKGRYRATAQIAKGASGRTLRGVDLLGKSAGDRACVIQQGWPIQQGDRARRQFRQYDQRLAQLSRHPQVPRLLAVIVQPESWYLIWAFARGRSLAAQLAEGTPFTEVQVRLLLFSLLPVLQVVHEQGIVHRDLKPENIIYVTPDCPWLVDFSAAVVLDKSLPAGLPALTGGAQSVRPTGDAQYAAPEQLVGQPVFASDLFSLGVICVQLLTMVPPFELYSTAQNDQAWQTYLPAPISPGLAKILTKLLRPAPQRYRTAAAVLADLADLADLAALPDLPIAPEPSPEQSRPGQDRWRCRHQLNDHRGAVTAIATGDTIVVSGGSDRAIRIWTWQGECRQVIQALPWFGKGHRDRISALQIGDDGLTLLSSSDDGTLCEWSLVDCSRQSLVVSSGWGISAFTAIPGLLVSGGTNGTLQLWDLQKKTVIESWRQHQARISGLAISPNQQILLSASTDGTVRLWSLQTAEPLNVLQVGRAVTAMAVMPQWNVLALGDEQGQLQLWDLFEMRPLYATQAHRGAVTALSLSPQQLASGGEDAQIYLWGLPNAPKPRMLAPRMPAPSTPEGTLEQRLLKQPQELTRLGVLAHDWSVNAIAFSPSGDWLASGSADETLRLWQRQC